MDSITAKRIFKCSYGNSTNFMTPTVLEYGMATANLAWELSMGDGLSAGTVNYGVTVIEQIWRKTPTRRKDLSESFSTEAQAREYIKTLGKEQ